MNTIRGITEAHTGDYTVVGGNDALCESNISLVLLNRGGRYMLKNVIERLNALGFDQIFSVEPSLENWEIEELSQCYPRVRFVLFNQSSTVGERINTAAQEMKSDHFLVVWNDACTIQGGPASRIASRLNGDLLLSVPTLLNNRYEAAPIVKNPVLVKGAVNIMPSAATREGTNSLYPHDYAGLYERKRFLSLGGYDGGIASCWMQLLDFGFRAHLQGELIKTTQSFKLVCDDEVPPEDQTPNADVNRFWLKNIAPVLLNGYAHIPWRKFPRYLLRAGENPFEALREFREGREWVLLNRYRFVADARTLIEDWENPDL